MQAESGIKVSFFDDEDPTLKFVFNTPEQKHYKDLKLPSTVRNKFVVKSSHHESTEEAWYALHGKLLAQYKNEMDTEPQHVMDISFSRLKCIKNETESIGLSFSIAKNGYNYDFKCTDRQILSNWVDALKRICVLTSFHDDYKAIKMIGRGSFAKVYLIESKIHGKTYAVKAFTKDSIGASNKSTAKPSMLNEIDIMRAVDHENIIKLYEVYETEKSIYLVLELIQGKSLYDVLKRSSFKEELSPTKIINLVRSLLDSIAYLASKGIMHRDLKPDNILLDKGEKVKLVDFGLATFIDVPVYIFKKCGTPGYIAPEVFKYDDKDLGTMYDDRCDVFSVGCLFYYMLFGAPMFDGTTAPDILKNNRKFDAEFPIFNKIKMEIENPNGKISKEGLSLLLDLIENDCKKRISAAEALNHPYFVPIPTGMQKMSGSKEFVIDALSRYSQNEIKSPCSPLKTNPFNQDQTYSPLRLDTAESPLLPKQNERFVQQDSLYLDVGKPELNGRIDTLTSGSTNGSLLLTGRADSSNNLSSTCPPPSSFANKNINRSGTKPYKTSNQAGQNQSFLKAAIFRNMQKNNSEGLKEDDNDKSKHENLLASRAYSENVSPATSEEPEERSRDESQSQSPIKGFHENYAVSNEETGVQMSIEQRNLNTHDKHPSKPNNFAARKFHPFASANIVIPKNEAYNDL